MPTKLSTTVKKIDLVPNKKNSELIHKFHEYMKSNGASERHQNNNLKAVCTFANYLGDNTDFEDVNNTNQILSYLDTKIRSQEEDPDKKWITTWNDYLHRIKHFLRWLHNIGIVQSNSVLPMEDWITPSYLRIKEKKTKRISPYLETELWEKDEILLITKYEKCKRNKAILILLWDLDARNHEITLLKIKHIRLREKYGEGEIPQEAKTGSGPILLTCSFPYVRDLLNEHPFRNEPNARLICNLQTGAPIKPEALWTIMKQLRTTIIRHVETNAITNEKECQILEHLLKAKKWNPYCIRHSAITSDSDFLPEYALRKKVRWSMNSKQSSRYIKRRMGNDLKQTILVHNGIISPEELRAKPSVLTCPRCNLVNAIENKYCSKCSYPLVPSAYDEIKESEEKRIKKMEEQIQMLISSQKEMLECLKYPEKLAQIAQEK